LFGWSAVIAGWLGAKLGSSKVYLFDYNSGMSTGQTLYLLVKVSKDK